jgi:hypothetical protein
VGPLTHSRFGRPRGAFPEVGTYGLRQSRWHRDAADGFAIFEAWVTPRRLLVAPKFHYVEVVLAADARRKIHRQLLAALPDLRVVG